MQTVRLLADDLTGALDTAAELAGRFGALDVVWDVDPARRIQASLAIDSGTRELVPENAATIVQALAPTLRDATVAYKKIDSLLRGPWVTELAACLRTGFWDACIVAPAFIHQGRQTRGGQQYALMPDRSWSRVGETIQDQLRRGGLDAHVADSADDIRGGVTVFDAESESDLDRVVETGRRYQGRLLWCGSGGLASALARGTDAVASRRLRRPVLGVFGSDHPATRAQLALCRDVLASDGLDGLKRRMAEGAAFVLLRAPEGSARAEAARRFSDEIARLSESIDPPGTLIVAGGETLRAQCVAVNAHALMVTGRLEPGVPRSVIHGGRWAGVDVISKSGAFGPPDLWWKLLNDNGLI
ncbi:Hrp-dependent type III effector protein [Bradyrhizobium lablabi]|nr:Hrp-dependent type III effector protein [Bradyrhizobium lablabi]